MKQPDPLVAIRAYCLLCSGDSRKEVESCRIPTCPLYPFRSLKALTKQPSPLGEGGSKAAG